MSLLSGCPISDLRAWKYTSLLCKIPSRYDVSFKEVSELDL
jgi:hypothetical protein